MSRCQYVNSFNEQCMNKIDHLGCHDQFDPENNRNFWCIDDDCKVGGK